MDWGLGEPQGQGLVTAEGDGWDDWTIHVSEPNAEGDAVAIEDHGVVGEVEEYTYCVSFTEEVVFSAEGVEEGAAVGELLGCATRQAPGPGPDGTGLDANHPMGSGRGGEGKIRGKEGGRKKGREGERGGER